jgi:hypothetical protein
MTKFDITVVNFSSGPNAKLLFPEFKCAFITSPIYNFDAVVGYGLDNRETVVHIQADAGSSSFAQCPQWL